jgi:phage terminase small subunit
MARPSERNEFGLSSMEERFCREYVYNGGAQTEAYLKVHERAKYWKNTTVRTRAYELMQQARIKDRIATLEAERLARIEKKHEINDDRITQEYARIAFFDIRRVFNPDGTLKGPHELEDDVAAALLSLEVDIQELGKGENSARVITAKVKAINKIDALRDLGKHIGYFAKDNEQQKPETINYNNVELPAHLRRGIPSIHDESEDGDK